MDFKKLRPVFEVVFLAVVAFLCHQLFFYFLKLPKAQSHFHYSLLQLYAFFTTAAVVIVFLLICVKQKNIDSVGQAFMLVTCIKMVLAYLLLHPILYDTTQNTGAEKTNFFIVFALFLTIETVVTIRILNNKQ